jgi:hypothetical protein
MKCHFAWDLHAKLKCYGMGLISMKASLQRVQMKRSRPSDIRTHFAEERAGQEPVTKFAMAKDSHTFQRSLKE